MLKSCFEKPSPISVGCATGFGNWCSMEERTGGVLRGLHGRDGVLMEWAIDTVEVETDATGR